MKKLTLEEVAKLAGVSRSTVSRVVNNPERMSRKNRERILKVIDETSYQPHQAARILASQRSNIIGLIIPSRADLIFMDPYFAALITGISRACNAHDCTLNDIAIVGFDDLPPAIIADPPLTTIRQPINQNGMLAVETLIDLLETGPDPPRHTILPTELIIRATCGATEFDSEIISHKSV
jgi:DNA-binding LacI/PurR family transcriptional regulator